jgi:hypothetical protein
MGRSVSRRDRNHKKKKKKKKVDQKSCAHLSESTLMSILVFNVVDGDDGFGVDGGDGVVAG